MSYLGDLARGAIAAAALALPASAQDAGQDLPTLRAAVLEVGTVNWELQTIKDYGLDTQNGFNLELLFLADNGATRVALAGGEADMVVADWIWVATQRAAGQDYVTIPYSTAVGGVMVPADSTAQTLEDLRGQKIGIAGGPVDKSWLILRAYTEQEYGFDLADETEQVFGAPPLIMQSVLSGETQGAINFWHFMAKMKAAGMRELISVADASEALGLDPSTPLLGYVISGEFARNNPEVIEGLARASLAAEGDPADRRRRLGGAAAADERRERGRIRRAERGLDRRHPDQHVGRRGPGGTDVRPDVQARRVGAGRRCDDDAGRRVPEPVVLNEAS